MSSCVWIVSFLIVFRGREPALERLDGVGNAADEELARWGVLRLAGEDLLPRELVADDLDLGAVDLVPVRVIEVIVRVHDPANRLRRDRLELFAQRPRAAGDTCESTTSTSRSPSTMVAFDITTRLPVPTA